MNKNFTISKGIEVQQTDLAAWRTILSAEAYMALWNECERQNAELEECSDATGYDVFRGQHLTEFVTNFASARVSEAQFRKAKTEARLAQA